MNRHKLNENWTIRFFFTVFFFSKTNFHMNKAFTTEISLFNDLMLMRQNFDLGPVRACSHGGGGPQEGGVTNLSLFLDRVHMRSGVPHRPA